MKLILVLVAISLVGLVVPDALAQPAKTPQQPTIKKPAKPVETEPEDISTEREVDGLKVDTNLVAVPVIASSSTGKYIADLTKEEFSVAEDGTPQQIAFLATVNTPFHVVLLLDTSGSTREKLPLLQRAAVAFVEQLRAADKVKIISFDDTVRDWNDFTGDKALLRSVISQMEPGSGTKVYDAMDRALSVLRAISGRKAIVLFSDALDWHSESSTFEGSLRNLDESGVIVYPIRFETRAETERIARQQDAETNGANLPTSETIRSTPSGTPPTVPSSDPDPTDRSNPGSVASIIFSRPGGRTGQDPSAGRRRPDPGTPTDPFPGMPGPPPPITQPGTTGATRRKDTISTTLDQAYLMADSYLKALADRSGGQVYRADTIAMLPQAFAAIASELRTQYLLGYYPTNRNQDGAYRKIQVKTSRQNVTIRARPGYRARRGN
jgi:VWFA-related protein